jgi:hypothetical protein
MVRFMSFWVQVNQVEVYQGNQTYGHSEFVIGKELRHEREKVVVVFVQSNGEQSQFS